MVTRVNTLRLLLNYDAVVDTDVRDRALDVLVPLLELDSPRMATRLARGSNNNNNNNNNIARIRLYDALIPAITTTAGRTGAAAVAAQLLRELAKAEEADDESQLSQQQPQHPPGLDYAQQRLVQIASRDPRVSQLVWKELYPIQQHSNNTDDDDDDDDEQDNDGHNIGDQEPKAANKMDSAGEMSSTSQQDGVAGKGKDAQGN